MGSQGFSRFPSPHSLVSSDGFVPMLIVPTVLLYFSNRDVDIGDLVQSFRLLECVSKCTQHVTPHNLFLQFHFPSLFLSGRNANLFLLI